MEETEGFTHIGACAFGAEVSSPDFRFETTDEILHV